MSAKALRRLIYSQTFRLRTLPLASRSATMSSNHSSGIAAHRIKIDVTSDAICPFCFIGYKNLNTAITQAQSNGVPLDYDLEFKPFLLDPTLGSESVSKRERYRQKFGPARAGPMEQAIVDKGKAVGINFSYGGTLSQTHDYHRVMAYAFKSGGEKLQRTLAESFFHGYFENEQDPGQSPYLIRIAVETGVFANEVEAKNWFESNDQWTEVRAGYKTAQAMGITGVPFFVFENRYAISGAQPPEAFVEIFEKLAEEKGLKVGALATNGVHEADACDIDRKNC